MPKKIFYSYFFLITYPQAHYLQSKKFNCLQKFCIKFYFACIISVRSTPLWEKGRIRMYLWLIDPYPRGPKTCGSSKLLGCKLGLFMQNHRRLMSAQPIPLGGKWQSSSLIQSHQFCSLANKLQVRISPHPPSKNPKLKYCMPTLLLCIVYEIKIRMALATKTF